VLLPQSLIEKLDTPCLVRVLQQLSSQQQLVVCGAVCSKWRTATREAINSIAVPKCTQEKRDQLQQWAIDPPAALYRLYLHLSDRHAWFHPLSLRLPLSVLQHLRDLELHSMRLKALAADGSVLKVVDLLPRLQHCTKLTLRARCNVELMDAAAAFQAMPALQDLDIEGEDAGLPYSLAPLPATLTRLCLESHSEGAITTANAASICQLTGLRVLELTATYGFDTSEEAWWCVCVCVGGGGSVSSNKSEQCGSIAFKACNKDRLSVAMWVDLQHPRCTNTRLSL